MFPKRRHSFSWDPLAKEWIGLEDWEEGILRPVYRRHRCGHHCCLWWVCSFSGHMHPVGRLLSALQVHPRSVWLGRPIYFPGFLSLLLLLLSHVSARTFSLYCWKWHHPSSPDILSPAKNSDSPPFSLSCGRIALWSFYCLKVVVGKWQTWPWYLRVTGSRDALRFLSLRKILCSEKQSFWAC